MGSGASALRVQGLRSGPFASDFWFWGLGFRVSDARQILCMLTLAGNGSHKFRA